VVGMKGNGNGSRAFVHGIKQVFAALQITLP
jgi:hypothetical protein